MPENDDISLILAKAKKSGFLEDIKNEEVNFLKQEALKLFSDDKILARPQRFYAGHYASLSDLFTARQSYEGPAVIELDGLTSYQAANLRIDRPDTILNGNGATITIPAGNNQNGLNIGVNAIRLRLKDFNLVGNYANQTGISNGIVFEDYSDVPFRYADRTNVEDVNIDGFLTTGAIIGQKRLHVVFTRTFIRDSGLYGLDMNASDCRFLDGAVGGIRGQYGIRVNQGANWISNNGIYSNTVAGILLTDKASGCKIVNNDLDNNLGSGLHAVGVGSSALNTSIVGNHFRGNSTSGEGVHSDVYLEQVSNISFIGNYFYSQLGSAARSKYNVDAGAGVTASSIRDNANYFQSTYPVLGNWSTSAASSRSNRAFVYDLSLEGSSDVRFSRQGAGVQLNSDFTSLGTILASVLSITGTNGSGFLQLIEQGIVPSAPAADKARIFIRDNGSGKTQTCVLYSDGSIGILHTQA